MNRNCRILLTIVTLFLSHSALSAQNLPFKDGESMRMVIHYKWGSSTDIGELDIKIKDEGPSYYLAADIFTYKFWDGIYKVRDFYESRFDKTTLNPIYFHRDVKEGKFWAKNWYNWSNDAATMTSRVEKKTRPRRDTVYNEPVIIRDVISLFYHLRASDIKALESGKRLCCTIAIDRNVLDLVVRFDKREVRKIKELGTFNTIKLAVAVSPRKMGESSRDEGSKLDIVSGQQTKDGVFYGEEKIFIWLSDDANRLFLQFSSPVAVGSINGRAIEYKNVKYPMSSLVKPAK